MVGGKQRLRARCIDLAAGMHAPVVQGDRHVEQQAIDAGKVEIDDAADALGGRFVALTELRGLPVVELEVVRRAYTLILG